MTDVTNENTDNEPVTSYVLNEFTGRRRQVLTCPKCEHTTNRQKHMKQHIMRKHSKYRPYKCSHSNCKYATISEFALEDHMNVHTLEKSFNCPSCDKEYTTSAMLNKHVLIAHTLPDDEAQARVLTHECPHCPAIFSRALILRNHVASHLDVCQPEFKCSICNFSSNTKWRIGAHMKRTHVNVNVHHECTQCDFTAKMKTTFAAHVAKCKGEKPYTCNKCDFKSSVLGNLYKHSEIHFVGQ